MEQRLSLSEIKKIELQILIELKKICNDNNLHYRLISGTLLGAIRHKGFIPWDDDIDISMPRPDYDKLIELYQKNTFPEHLKLLAYELGNYNRPFLKLVDTRTIVINEKKYIKDGNADSLWIDIIPVDGVPSDKVRCEKEFKKTARLYKMVQLSYAYLGKGASPIRAAGKTFVALFAKLLGGKFWNNQIIKTARKMSYDSSDYVGEVAFTWYGINTRMKRCEYETPVEVDFEGEKFTVVEIWDQYLKGLYGDYRILPPEEKRRTHDMIAYMK